MDKINRRTQRIALLILGLLAGSTHAAPNLWGPKAVSPESFHIQEDAITQQSFRYVSLHPVLFHSGKATISPEGQKALDAAASYLLKHDDIKRILIEGNTDYVGAQGYNDNLSERRSAMVRNYLTLKGVSPDLMVLSGKGEIDPVDQNWTRDGRRRNRHVAIHALHWERPASVTDVRSEPPRLPPPPQLPAAPEEGDAPLDWQQSSFGR